MQNSSDHLYILWTNADINTSLHMVLMYSTNAKIYGWWERVTVIIWGATAKLVTENAEIREHLQLSQDKGVEFTACKACAQLLGVAADLKEQGIEVTYWGEGLTELLKSGAHLITV